MQSQTKLREIVAVLVSLNTPRDRNPDTDDGIDKPRRDFDDQRHRVKDRERDKGHGEAAEHPCARPRGDSPVELSLPSIDLTERASTGHVDPRSPRIGWPHNTDASMPFLAHGTR